MNCFAARSLLCPVLACLLTGLAGCGPTGWDAPFDTYLTRLARTLDQDYSAPISPAAAERMPRPAEITRAFPRDTLDGIDFLALHGCELQVTIGRRNSSLGRMATASQRLLLELEYLQLAPACITRLRQEDKEELAAVLESAWRDKRHQLPRRIFHATLAADEYRRFWQPRSPGNVYPDDTNSTVITALEQINGLVRRWLGGDYRFDNRGFEVLLSRVSPGDGGQLWQALALQAAWLDRANALLQARAADGPLCRPNYRPDSARILPNVISKFFVDGIQARAAKLGRRQHQLYAPLRELEQLLQASLPAAYRAWQQRRDAQIEHLAAAPRRHVEWLQRTLQPCIEDMSGKR